MMMAALQKFKRLGSIYQHDTHTKFHKNSFSSKAGRDTHTNARTQSDKQIK